MIEKEEKWNVRCDGCRVSMIEGGSSKDMIERIQVLDCYVSDNGRVVACMRCIAVVARLKGDLHEILEMVARQAEIAAAKAKDIPF